MSKQKKPREFWIGWPDGENPTICESYDLGCVKFIEKSFSDAQALEIEKLKSELRLSETIIKQLQRGQAAWDKIQGETNERLQAELEAVKEDRDRVEVVQRGASMRCDRLQSRVEILKKRLSGFTHNHFTRNIKEYGKCPACDSYHKSQTLDRLTQANEKLKKALEDYIKAQIQPGENEQDNRYLLVNFINFNKKKFKELIADAAKLESESGE